VSGPARDAGIDVTEFERRAGHAAMKVVTRSGEQLIGARAA
jgi:hypothetical protein